MTLAGAMWHSQVVLFRWNSAAELSSPLPTLKKSVQKANRRAESQTGQHPFPAIGSGFYLWKQQRKRPRPPAAKHTTGRIQQFQWTGMGWNRALAQKP
jgi:hypothetical protein